MPKPSTKAKSPIPRVDYNKVNVENAIKSVPLSDWQGFFEHFRLEYYQRLKVSGSDANEIQQIVRASVFVEGIFTSIKA